MILCTAITPSGCFKRKILDTHTHTDRDIDEAKKRETFCNNDPGISISWGKIATLLIYVRPNTMYSLIRREWPRLPWVIRPVIIIFFLQQNRKWVVSRVPGGLYYQSGDHSEESPRKLIKKIKKKRHGLCVVWGVWLDTELFLERF